MREIERDRMREKRENERERERERFKYAVFLTFFSTKIEQGFSFRH